MKLSLIPIDGEKVISDKEKELMKRRAFQIPSKALGRFDNEDRKQIKDFLISLITLSEQIHHDMTEHAKERGDTDSNDMNTSKLQAQRQALFDNPSPTVGAFIGLLHFHAMESWHEFETMIASIRGEGLQHEYDAKLQTTADSSHTDAENEIERAIDKRLELAMRCRITPHEIKELIQSHSLESLVKHLIEGRRSAIGAIWDVSHYDL